MKKNYDFSKMKAIKNPYAAILKSMNAKDILISTDNDNTNKFIKPNNWKLTIDEPGTAVFL
jgi:hypothetical protein